MKGQRYVPDITYATTLVYVLYHSALLSGSLEQIGCTPLLVGVRCTLRCQMKGEKKKETPCPCGMNARLDG